MLFSNYLWFEVINWKLTGSLAVLLIYVPIAKVLHKIPYVVIHSSLDILGSLPLNDSQDVCEIHFCKCGFPPFPPHILPSLSLCLQIITAKGHWIKNNICKGQSAVCGVLSEMLQDTAQIVPLIFKLGIWSSWVFFFSTALPSLPLLFSTSLSYACAYHVPLSWLEISSLVEGSQTCLFRVLLLAFGEGEAGEQSSAAESVHTSTRAELLIPACWLQQEARGACGTCMPEPLQTALLKGMSWAHFWGKFPFWGSCCKGISCVGRQSFLTWRLLGRETVS